MADLTIPHGLPQCELLTVLVEKANEPRAVDFHFLSRLNDFRQRVSAEVRNINQLFPEYTPHDEEYHLKHLFTVADTILGRERFEGMHASELFVLACSIYGHDWGMAVSDTEREYILHAQAVDREQVDDLWVLPDERKRLAKFLREQRLFDTLNHPQGEIVIEHWREYIRQTHAFRSAERTRRFFEHIDGGVADAVSRVCAAHWLEFAEITDHRSYPPDFSVLRESVNLRALAIYLRLIDLLDLAEDRTPYVIWKYVAPRDPHSKMEWAKHRALRPVTCPAYQSGRIIQVDGSTDDHEVYAALEDLRIWCEGQFRECNDVLGRMKDPRHRLDLYHIDWRVMPRGFRPISIQFEFNRGRMFEILSDEIYQGDPYVFLRELLQNSIDAIRMRREVLQQNGIPTTDLGVIKVHVEHSQNADAVITWTDDGVGMDEYIVRNYLAIAGNSYYESTDFQREGLDLDPISRFGVGILSCFMVAESIEIDTYREPYLPPAGEPLRIKIPAMRGQFRIEESSRETAQVGTTVRVYVEGKKIRTDDEKPQPLNVTDYLSAVAGFVEFPILITEGDQKTVVLHPKQNADAAIKRFGREYKIRQIDLGYPFPEVFLPQDLASAQTCLRGECYDLSRDLDLTDYEGVLIFPTPVDDTTDFYGGNREAVPVIRCQDKEQLYRFRWKKGWVEYSTSPRVGLSRSSKRSDSYLVYRDGILLSSASVPQSTMIEVSPSQSLPLPRIVVNLSKNKAKRIDLARTEILDDSEHWDKPIWKAFLDYHAKNTFQGFLQLPPKERWYRIARFAAIYRMSLSAIWEVFPNDRWPIGFLETGGTLAVLEWKDVEGEDLHCFPSPQREMFSSEIVKFLFCQFETKRKYTGKLVNWEGGRTLTDGFYFHTLYGHKLGAIVQTAISRSHSYSSTRFLQPVKKGYPCLDQDILAPREITDQEPNRRTILKTAAEEPMSLASEEIVWLRRSEPGFGTFYVFQPPFAEHFAYGWQLFNLRHRYVQFMFRCAAMLELATQGKKGSGQIIGEVKDAYDRVIRAYPYSDINLNCMLEVLSDLYESGKKIGLVCNVEFERLKPSCEEFIPGTVVHKRGVVMIRGLKFFLESLRLPKGPLGDPILEL